MSSSQTDPTYINSLIEDVAYYGIEFMLKLPQYAQHNPNAFKELVTIGTPAVAPLINALLNDDLDIRRAKVAMVLGEIGNPQAIEPLTQVCSDNNTEVVNAAYDALKKIQSQKEVKSENTSHQPSAEERQKRVETLLALLNEEKTRQNAIEELGAIGDPRAFFPLFQMARDDQFSPSIRQMACDALDKIQEAPGDEKERVAYWVWKKEWDKLVETGASAAEPLLTCIRNLEDDAEISAILQTIVKIGPAAIDPLTTCLKKQNLFPQIFTARALGMLQDPRAGDALCDLIAQNNQELEKNRHIYSDAWESLVIGALLESAMALNKIKDIRGVTPLIDALFECFWFWNDSSDGVSTTFYFEIKRAVNVSLFHKKEWDPISEAAEALGENVPEAIDMLTSELDHTSFEKKYIIIKLLQLIKDPRAVDPLIKILNTKHTGYFIYELTSLAAEALGKIGNEGAVEALMLILEKNPGYDNGEYLRSSAVQALGKIGDRRAIDALLSVRNIRNLQTKVDTALQQLGWQGSPKP